MKANRSRISSLWALVLGGLLVGAPLVARASQPTTATEAQQRAEAFNKRADSFKFQGGTFYKTGLIQRAEANAASCDTVANAMQTTSVLAVATPGNETLRDSGAVVAVLVPSNQAAPSSPRCPAP
jgi:hypothetical protein